MQPTHCSHSQGHPLLVTPAAWRPHLHAIIFVLVVVNAFTIKSNYDYKSFSLMIKMIKERGSFKILLMS